MSAVVQEGGEVSHQLNLFLTFVFFFFLIFGWKVNYFDLSVFVPFLLLPFLVKRLVISLQFYFFVFMLSVLFVYQAVIQVLNHSFSVEPLGRVLRSMLAVLTIGLFLSSLNRRDLMLVLRIIFVVIFAHSLIIIATALNLPLAEVVSGLSGNERYRWLRSSGLLAGFDIAGFITIIGALLLVSKASPYADGVWKFIALIVLFLAACFTSRVSMLLAAVVFFTYIGKLVFLGKLAFGVKFLVLVISSALFFFTFFWFLKILEVTFSLGIVEVSTSEVQLITSVFSAQKIEGFPWANMFFLPNNVAGILFGVGAEPEGSDVGYVREIFRYGAFGLSFVIVAHIMFLLQCFYFKPGYILSSEFWLTFVVISLILLLTFKNNYLLVRGLFPCFVIIAYCFGCLSKKHVETVQI